MNCRHFEVYNLNFDILTVGNLIVDKNVSPSNGSYLTVFSDSDSENGQYCNEDFLAILTNFVRKNS
jgi:hypothetical protein